MVGLVKNEIIKVWYRKKFLIAIMALLIVTIGMFILIINDSGDKKIKKIRSDIVELQKREKSASSNEKKDLQKRIEDSQSHIDYYNEDLKNPNTYWKQKAKEDIYKDKQSLKSNDTSIQSLEKEKMKLDILSKQYLLDNNIRPSSAIKPGSGELFTVYLDVFGIFVIFLVSTIFTADIVSSEFSPAYIKSILSRPVSKFNIILSKGLAAAISSFLVISIIEIVIFTVLGFVYGFSGYKEPVPIYPKFNYSDVILPSIDKHISPILNTGYIMPQYKFILEVIMFQIIFIAASVCVCLMISTILKSNSAAVGTCTILQITFVIFTNLRNAGSAIIPIFFSYGDVSEIIDRQFIMKTGACYMDIYKAALILIIWIIASIIISKIVFNKKDILI
ncbi:ABC transporter permease subunit [Clostridium sp. P21]|uniref:ABC transporter permease subunit n=1 Tax=Clostridium muellerianum TaxID=2716538 RepID=A0A7Y0ED54_9CLOT|nr:ABC transporter permease subunit [Clostridium muellerianum]NMM61309.1 ABC transporter permease subunit [Clostridium muellerianum]